MKIKKWAKIALIPLVIVAVGATVAGCSSKTKADTTTQITYTVKKGTVAQEITAVGNLNYSDEEELSFDTGGTLSEVDVNVGDSVTKGQVLAKLDMTQYQQNITSLQEQLAQKKLSLVQSQQQETTAEQTVTDKQHAVVTAQNTLASDQYALVQAQRALEQQQLNIANDQLTVQKDQYAFEANTGGTWASDNLALAKQQLAVDQAKTADYNQNIKTAQNNITAAQWAVQDAQAAVTDAQTAVTIAKSNVANAQQAVNDAQTTLTQAQATSPEITAPIDGLIIAVNTTAGQTIYKGETIVTMVDPNKFEADISIGETDISNVKVGGSATLEFDALSGVTLPGKITNIAPTATTSQGVVSYAVTVDVESLQNLAGQFPQHAAGEQSSTSGSQSGQRQFTPGQLPSGSSTFQGSQSGSRTYTRGQNVSGSAGTTATTSPASQPVQLRQGMTTTVNIVYQMASNVLVVPNQAITLSGNTATVNLLKNGTTTKQTIQTGLSNSTLTEVTSGLKEGDTIVYSRTVSTTSSSSNSSNARSGGGFPGGGGFFMRGG